MAVQDDSREKEMCQLLGLREGEGRSEVDAFFDFEENERVHSAPIELKSTTTGSVSTDRRGTSQCRCPRHYPPNTTRHNAV